MSTILDEIVANKLIQLEEEKKQVSLEELKAACEGKIIRDFEAALEGDEISVISEIKKASPSRGVIKEDFDPVETAKIYEKSPFHAISVLTEKKYFLGDDSYIAKVKEVTTKPIIRKDFIVDEYQIYQSKAIGADAILLIAACLKGRIKAFYDLAKSLGLHVLLEVHDVEELEESLASGCRIIGINNRNLKDFVVDLKITEEVIKHIPKDRIVVSESGIKTADDIEYLKGLGVKAVLIGETLMRSLEDTSKLHGIIKE